MNRLPFAILFLVSGALRAAQSAAAEPAVKMSPYEVRANSVEFKEWIKVGSPNFILYTDARESEASTTLREFEMLHAAGEAVFGRRAAQFGPTIIILPTARSDWRKLQTKGGAEEWQSAVAAVGGRVANLVVVQYDWQEEGRGPVRAIYSVVDQERMEIEGPFWFGRGMQMFYETAQFDGDTVSLGHVSPRVFVLKNRRWLPWGRFFEVDQGSPEFLKEDLVVPYEAQAALFIQYLFANPDRAWAGRLVAWLDYLRSDAPPSEARFAEIFGQNWKAWQQTMDTYLESGSYNLFQIEVPPTVAHFKITKFDLPVREMRELFILTQTMVQAVPESEASLDALLAKGLRSPSLRELLVEACLHWRRNDAALKTIRELIADGSTNARVYRQGDALLTTDGGPFGPDVRYGSELKEVREWDRRGLALEPQYSDLNESFAVNEAGAPVVDQQGITTIEDCYRRIKGRAPTDRVLTALTIALWRIGDAKTAEELAKRLVDDPLVRKRQREQAADVLRRIQAGVRPVDDTAPVNMPHSIVLKLPASGAPVP